MTSGPEESWPRRLVSVGVWLRTSLPESQVAAEVVALAPIDSSGARAGALLVLAAPAVTATPREPGVFAIALPAFSPSAGRLVRVRGPRVRRGFGWRPYLQVSVSSEERHGTVLDAAIVSGLPAMRAPSVALILGVAAVLATLVWWRPAAGVPLFVCAGFALLLWMGLGPGHWEKAEPTRAAAELLRTLQARLAATEIPPLERRKGAAPIGARWTGYDPRVGSVRRDGKRE